MCKLCTELLTHPKARIKLVGSDNKEYKVLSFSYVTNTDICMTLLAPSGYTLTCTRRKTQIYCVDCKHQR